MPETSTSWRTFPIGRGHRTFDELITRAERLDLSGLVVQVAALDDVIESKQWADRPKDRDALPELLRLREQQAGG